MNALEFKDALTQLYDGERAKLEAEALRGLHLPSQDAARACLAGRIQALEAASDWAEKLYKRMTGEKVIDDRKDEAGPGVY